MPAPTAADILSAIETVRTEMHARLDAIEKAMATRPAAPVAASGGAADTTLPNYGRRKNEPIHGCPISDLEYYVAGCRRTLDDPSKSRWHPKERALLAALEAEIARQRGGADAGASVPDDTDGLPF